MSTTCCTGFGGRVATVLYSFQLSTVRATYKRITDYALDRKALAAKITRFIQGCMPLAASARRLAAVGLAAKFK
jgi:hypothetical protein